MRNIGSEVYQAQHGTGKVIGVNTDGETAPGTLYRVEFSSGTDKVVSGGELFDSYTDFAERNAEDYHR